MATTYLENGLSTPNGSHLTFSYPFPVLKTEDVKVALNGVTQATTKYTVDNTSNPTTITFNNTNIDSNLQESTGAPKTGVIVRVYRDTDVDSPKAVYAAGSSIRALDLNNNHDQLLYALQEEQNQKGIFESISLDDDVKIKLGNSDDFTIYYKSSTLDAILENAGDIYYKSTGRHVFEKNGEVSFQANGTGVEFKANVTPWNDDTWDLGSSSYQWKDLYISGTAKLASVDINGGAIDGTIIGGSSPAAGTFTTGTIATADINGGAIDGTTIGASSASTGKFTQANIDNIQLNGNEIDTTSGNLTIDSNGGTVTVDDNLTVNGTVDLDNITGDAVVTSGTSTSDTKVYSAKRCDELYYNLASAEEIQSGETWVAADNKVATTSAIDARIVDLVDDVGGFVPIANETSFPNANPDVNNGAGTLLSIKALSNSITTGSGVTTHTISNGAGANKNVTITGLSESTTYTAGYGLILETTQYSGGGRGGNANEYEYTFHRYVPNATSVTTVAGNTTNINKVAAIDGNVTKVADIDGNVTKVADIDDKVTTVANDESDIGIVAGAIGNVNTVAGKATEIGRLGTTDAVADLALLGTAAVVEDLSLLGTTAAVADMALLGDSAVIADMATIADTSNLITNIGTVAGIHANVTTVAGDTTAINNITTNLSAVQNAATNATNAASSATAAASSATSAATSATTATTQATTATTQASTATTQATNAASSASTASTQATNAGNSATTATTQASNASTSAANALAYKDLALTYRNDASGILTQTESIPYNLVDTASTHTAWGNITDTGVVAFANETSNTMLSMSEGSATYNYGSIT